MPTKDTVRLHYLMDLVTSSRPHFLAPAGCQSVGFLTRRILGETSIAIETASAISHSLGVIDPTSCPQKYGSGPVLRKTTFLKGKFDNFWKDL